VFLLNSRYPQFCATIIIFFNHGTPFPEVTESICRVPSMLFSQAL